MKATVEGSGVFAPGSKKKKKKKKKMHFYRLLQIEVVSKREKYLGYICRQINSLRGLSSPPFFRLIQVKSIVEDASRTSGIDPFFRLQDFPILINWKSPYPI